MLDYETRGQRLQIHQVSNKGGKALGSTILVCTVNNIAQVFIVLNCRGLIGIVLAY